MGIWYYLWCGINVIIVTIVVISIRTGNFIGSSNCIDVQSTRATRMRPFIREPDPKFCFQIRVIATTATTATTAITAITAIIMVRASCMIMSTKTSAPRCTTSQTGTRLVCAKRATIGARHQSSETKYKKRQTSRLVDRSMGHPMGRNNHNNNYNINCKNRYKNRRRNNYRSRNYKNLQSRIKRQMLQLPPSMY